MNVLNAIDHLYSSPWTLVTLAALAALAIGYARWQIGREIWSAFGQAACEDLEFLRAAASPWTWPRRWRKWRVRGS